jgi:hypothetical protein
MICEPLTDGVLAASLSQPNCASHFFKFAGNLFSDGARGDRGRLHGPAPMAKKWWIAAARIGARCGRAAEGERFMNGN